MFYDYVFELDPTIVVALNSISVYKEKIMQSTSKAVVQLLKYAVTHSEVITRYHARVMVLHIHSNESFLSEKKVNSIYVVCHYLRALSADHNNMQLQQSPINDPTCTKSTTMKNVLSSAMEAELGDLFFNFQQEEAMRIELI